jgi:hypothetical protein
MVAKMKHTENVPEGVPVLLDITNEVRTTRLRHAMG